MTGEDPYRILGLDAEADEEQVRRAYFRAVRCCPPEVDVQGFTRVRGDFVQTEKTEPASDFYLKAGCTGCGDNFAADRPVKSSVQFHGEVVAQ